MSSALDRARRATVCDGPVILANLMRGQEVHDGDRAAFYRATLHTLRFCDAQEAQARRFGPDADALWANLAGGGGGSVLRESERIDLLLRDADAQWPGAFAPRVVFRLEGLADDEPFGPSWPSLEPTLGADFWREIADNPPSPDLYEFVEAFAGAWGLDISPCGTPEVIPTSRLVVAGFSAIAAAIFAFADGEDLSWGDQVLVVAERPAARQLASVASARLRAQRPTNLRSPAEPPRAFAQAHLITSSDADPESIASARKIAGDS